MRVLIIICLLCLAPFARGATGEILGASITTNSCLDVYVENFPTNTTFNNGLINWTNIIGTNSVWYQRPSTTNGLTLTMDAYGFRNGEPVWRRITRYGTIIGPKPYPNHAQSDIVTNLGTPNITKIRVFLNDYVFTNTITSNIAVTITTNAFKDGSTFCLGATDFPVTNLSTLPSPPVAGWFTVPGWTDETNANMYPTVFAEAAYGVDSVRVLAWTGSAGSTNLVYRPNINRSLTNRGKLWPDYQATLPQSPFTAGDTPRIDFEVYPIIGERFSTLSNWLAGHHPLPSSITNLCNKSGTLNTNFAVVSVSGSDATGVPTNGISPTDINSAHEFASVPRAVQALLASNSWFGGIVYVRQGQTNVGGSTPVFANVAQSRVILKPFPGETFRIETNTSSGTSRSLASLLSVENCDFYVDGTNHIIWDNQERIHLKNCTVDFRGHALRASSSSDDCIIFAEGCWINRAGGGLVKNAGEDLAWNLYGCDLNGFTNTWLVYVGLGNWHTNRAGTNMLVVNAAVSNLQFPPINQLFAYNQLLGLYGSATQVGEFGDPTFATTNMFMVNNEIEAIKATSGAHKSWPLWNQVANMTGLVAKRNTIFGPRIQRLYNENGFSIKQGFLEDESIDISGFVGDVEEADGTYIGGWWYLNGVGLTGCAIPGTSQIAHGIARYAAFQNTYFSGNNGRPYGWWSVFRRAAYSGAGDPESFEGDYRIHSYAPTFGIPTVGGGYYDFDGLPRPSIAGWASPGARASGNPKNGGGFFAF